MAEGAPLLREYGLKTHRGFESLSLRQLKNPAPGGVFYLSKLTSRRLAKTGDSTLTGDYVLYSRHRPPKPKEQKMDIKLRSWGMAGKYGVTPLSDAGRDWVEGWLQHQPCFADIVDGAWLFEDDARHLVAQSAINNGLKAVAGIGNDPTQGKPFDLNGWIRRDG